VRDGLAEAFEQGAAVTAKVTWLPRGRSAEAGEESRPTSRKGPGGAFGESTQQRTRYISCTPLLGSDDQVGVWMVVMVENELVTGSLASRTAALNRFNEPQVPPTPSEYQRESTSMDSDAGIGNGVGNGGEGGGGARFERSMSGHVRGDRGKNVGSEGGRLYADFMRNGGMGGGQGEEGGGGVNGANGGGLGKSLDFSGGGGDYLSNGMSGRLNGNGVVSGEGRSEEVRSP